MNLDTLGRWAFIIGLIIAVVMGIIPDLVVGYATTMMLILFIAGLLVGFLNITEKDVSKFLIAAVALLVLGVGSINALSILGVVSTYLNQILGNFIAFVAAAALVVALKAIVVSAKK